MFHSLLVNIHHNIVLITTLLFISHISHVHAAWYLPAKLVGCYSQISNGDSQGDYQFQSSGYCSSIGCPNSQYIAIKGKECICLSSLPSSSYKEDGSSNCNIACPGYDSEMCGGSSDYSVFYGEGYNSNDDSSSSDATLSSPSSTENGDSETSPSIGNNQQSSTIGGGNSASSSSNDDNDDDDNNNSSTTGQSTSVATTQTTTTNPGSIVVTTTISSSDNDGGAIYSTITKSVSTKTQSSSTSSSSPTTTSSSSTDSESRTESTSHSSSPSSSDTKDSDSNSNSSGGNKSSVGAIAGGVVGGVVGALLLAGVAIFFIRKRRSQDDYDDYDEEGFYNEKPVTGGGFGAGAGAAGGIGGSISRTVGSHKGSRKNNKQKQPSPLDMPMVNPFQHPDDELVLNNTSSTTTGNPSIRQYQVNGGAIAGAGAGAGAAAGGANEFVDPRLNPIMMGRKRLSDGSLADEATADYTRKVLQVANPDES